MNSSLPGLDQESDYFPPIRFDTGRWSPYHARAMGNPLQDRRAPQELAASGQVIEIADVISSFARLAEIVEADLGALNPDKLPPDWRDASVAGQLGFSFIDTQEGIPALDGQVAVTIDAVCQRCMQPFRLPLEANLRLIFAAQQSVSSDGDEYEVWELDGDELCPADLIEEALIMAIPYVAMHDNDAGCSMVVAAKEKADKTTMPFANLRSQMDQEN